MAWGPEFSISPDTMFQLHPCPGFLQRHPPLRLRHLRLQPCLYLHCELPGTQLAQAPSLCPHIHAQPILCSSGNLRSSRGRTVVSLLAPDPYPPMSLPLSPAHPSSPRRETLVVF